MLAAYSTRDGPDAGERSGRCLRWEMCYSESTSGMLGTLSRLSASLGPVPVGLLDAAASCAESSASVGASRAAARPMRQFSGLGMVVDDTRALPGCLGVPATFGDALGDDFNGLGEPAELRLARARAGVWAAWVAAARARDAAVPCMRRDVEEVEGVLADPVDWGDTALPGARTGGLRPAPTLARGRRSAGVTGARAFAKLLAVGLEGDPELLPVRWEEMGAAGGGGGGTGVVRLAACDRSFGVDVFGVSARPARLASTSLVSVVFGLGFVSFTEGASALAWFSLEAEADVEVALAARTFAWAGSGAGWGTIAVVAAAATGASLTTRADTPSSRLVATFSTMGMSTVDTGGDGRETSLTAGDSNADDIRLTPTLRRSRGSRAAAVASRSAAIWKRDTREATLCVRYA